MCGIFGYIGKELPNLSGFLLEAISKLEYRGYDSSGIAVVNKKGARIFKKVGEVKNLRESLNKVKIAGSLGIGHTRWATHGKVTVRNAHPHTDCTGNILIVHNGIIENFIQLKRNLLRKGHKFSSDTDSEVFAHLIEENLKDEIDFSEAVRLAFNKLKGLNAVVALFGDEEMVAFRSGSSLVAGIGSQAYFICSDIPALIQYTPKIVALEENQGVILTKNSILIIDGKSGKKKKAKPRFVAIGGLDEDKRNYQHFMLKEIYEQPHVLLNLARRKKDIRKFASLIKKSREIYFTACGTAANSGIAGTYLFSEIAKRNVEFVIASEFPYFEDLLAEKSILIAASQSGETIDTLEAVRTAKRHNLKVLGLVNIPESSLTRLADMSFFLEAGPEKAVVSTKAYIAKLSVFLMLAFCLRGEVERGIRLLKKTAREMNQMFKNGIDEKIRVCANKLLGARHIYLIGRGVNYATALEGALKLKEASYIHAEGFAGGELKHGVIALIGRSTPCIVIVANDKAKEDTLSNALELSSRGGFIIGISPTKEEVFDFWIEVPDVGVASPILSIVPLQLLAYYLGILKGVNPDKPRNLAKSVTVK